MRNSYAVTIFIITLMFFVSPVIAKTYSVKHEEVKTLFQSNEEATAKDALWTSISLFKVGVINDGTSRDGYAQYVCSVLYEYGFKGEKIWVHIIDIVKLTRDSKWLKLGQAKCL